VGLRLGSSSWPLWGLGVGRSDNPQLVCGGQGSSSHSLPVYLWMLSSGWVGSKHFQNFSTALLFPQLFCLSCAREVSRSVGGGGKTERNIVQRLAVWAVQRESVQWMTNLWDSILHKAVRSELPAPWPELRLRGQETLLVMPSGVNINRGSWALDTEPVNSLSCCVQLVGQPNRAGTELSAIRMCSSWGHLLFWLSNKGEFTIELKV
jgi:hypothetical protein